MAEQLETYGSAKLRVVFMDDEEIVLKLILYLKISMIFGHLITTQIRAFLNSTDKKFGNLK